ncbi:MAG: transposase [Treponema sp.]|nr:transposase [Treponema sp.]
MRKLRELQQGVWYEIRTQINNREPLFRASKVRVIFNRVLHEAELRFVFEIRSPRLKDDWLTFYIKPEDGLELPAIMKWLKQTFARRYNRETGRTGHIWGDRYWSRIVEGEAPENEENGAAAVAANTGVRPPGGKNEGPPGFPPIPPSQPPLHPAKRRQPVPRLRINRLSRLKPKRLRGRIRPESSDESESRVKSSLSGDAVHSREFCVCLVM